MNGLTCRNLLLALRHSMHAPPPPVLRLPHASGSQASRQAGGGGGGGLAAEECPEAKLGQARVSHPWPLYTFCAFVSVHAQQRVVRHVL